MSPRGVGSTNILELLDSHLAPGRTHKIYWNRNHVIILIKHIYMGKLFETLSIVQ